MADLFLDPLEDDDVRVRRDADREDQSRDAREGQRDRDQLDQRQEEQCVDEQAERRDEAEEAVVEEQEQDHQRQAGEAGEDRAVQRLLAERRRDRALREQRQVDRQGADPQELGQVLCFLDREVARDLCAGVPRDPLRVLDEVDDRPGDDLAVEDYREAVREVRRLLGVGDPDRLRLVPPPLRDPFGDFLERVLSVAREVEGDRDLAGGRVGLLLRAADLITGQLGPVPKQEPTARRALGLVDLGLRVVRRRLLAQDHVAPGDVLDDRALGLGVVGEAQEEVLLLLHRPHARAIGDRLAVRSDRLERALVEEVVVAARRGAEGLAVLFEAFGLLFLRLLDRVDQAVEWPLRCSVDVRVRRDDVRLEVVEEELRGVADLIDRVLRVLHLREPDRDLGLADPRDLRLGDAERVDPVADDVDGTVDVLAARLWHRRRPPRLVDQLGAALEVEALLGRLVQDHQDRSGHEDQHEAEDYEGAAAGAHLSKGLGADAYLRGGQVRAGARRRRRTRERGRQPHPQAGRPRRSRERACRASVRPIRASSRSGR